MPVQTIVINVADVERSVDFYTRFLQAVVIGDRTAERADLDLVTARLELHRTQHPVASTWIGDDLQKGFRHIGFKVDRLDELVIELTAADVVFHLDPLDAEGDVRITFFFDPDGTLLELVQGDLQYHSVADQTGVDAERALGVPDRPRFDHIAVTVDDFASAHQRYSSFGFEHLGTITQPNDPRGFQIDYLKGGDTVLEVFAYESAKMSRAPQLDSLGFVAAELGGPAVSGVPVLSDGVALAGGAAPSGLTPSGFTEVGSLPDARRVFADPDGFPIMIGS